MKYKNFEFSSYEYDGCVLKLNYRVDDFYFTEEINFNPNNKVLRELNSDEKSALDLSFAYLHLVAGISYYKTLLPENIVINTVTLNKEQSDFFYQIYFNGLGEFAFKNDLDLRNKINFPYDKNVVNEAIKLNLDKSVIVPIGGGKDSLTTLEILKTMADHKLYTFSVNNAEPIKSCCNASSCDNILVTRKISPLVIEINKDLTKYSAYNGHVPISAIIAFISVCAGIIYNCDTVCFSNEKSANTGNVLHNGVMVNHQWSKSFEAELLVHDFIQKYITPNFNYFSLLRPIYEIHIAKLMSGTDKYDGIFSSCNKNFRINKDADIKLWCCDCDKCRFVFLILAAFFKKDRLVNIFKKNLFDDESNFEGYKELCGLCGHKPFDCVGEVEEAVLAFCLLTDEYKNDYVVKKILPLIQQQYSAADIEQLTAKYFVCDFENSLLNDEYKKALRSFVGSTSGVKP